VDLNKLSTADRVIGAAGIVFFISLFFPWWGIDLGEFGTPSNSGWDYFLTGILPFLLIVVMIGQIVITRFTTTELPALPISWAQVHLIAGGVVAALLLLRTIIPADEGGGGFEVDLDRQWGLYISLLAAIGVAVGGFLKFQEGEDTTSGVSNAPPQPF
jgi:hypothetical protein